MTTITENFESVVAELISSASTDKARAFAIKITDQARVRGTEWLEANQHKLCIASHASFQAKCAPIADNRLHVLANFQTCLAK